MGSVFQKPVYGRANFFAKKTENEATKKQKGVGGSKANERKGRNRTNATRRGNPLLNIRLSYGAKGRHKKNIRVLPNYDGLGRFRKKKRGEKKQWVHKIKEITVLTCNHTLALISGWDELKGVSLTRSLEGGEGRGLKVSAARAIVKTRADSE